MYSISITSPKNAATMIQEFESKEAKDAYITREGQYSYEQLKKYWAAATKEERVKAAEALYIARMNFFKEYNHTVVEKEYA